MQGQKCLSHDKQMCVNAHSHLYPTAMQYGHHIQYWGADVLDHETAPGDGLPTNLLIGRGRLLSGLDQRYLRIKDKFTDVGKRGRQHCGVWIVVGATAFLFDDAESGRHQIMELDKTGDEETTKVLDWVIRALVDGRDKQVLLTTVAVHDGEEECDLLVLKLRVHKSVEEEAADIKRHLTLERMNEDLIRGLPVCEVGLDHRQRLDLKTTGEDFKREPFVTFFFFCENRKTLNHEASPKSLQEGQSSLCVDQDGAHLGGVLVDGNHCALEGGGEGKRREAGS